MPIHTFTDDALGERDAVGLAEEIHAGRVSPQEAVAAAIGRVEDVDPRLHAVAAQRYDLAQAEAARSRADGFFAGVPTFIKDNSDLAGLPTQQGTTAYAGRPKRVDGDVARLFAALGTVALGKTRLSEFGFSAGAEFAEEDPVLNPWDTSRISGASSAGAAALVASGAVPFAHANDGGGSIRIPAACCGLVGLKPTRGRTPSDKMNREMPVRIVADGVVTRTVRDTAAFLREAERVYRPVSMPPIGDIRGPGKRRLRIGLVTESVGGRTVDAETLRVVHETASLLEAAGHTIEPMAVPVPEYFLRDFLTYWSTLALFLQTTGRHTLDRSFDRRRTDNLTRGLARHALTHSATIPLAIARLQASQYRSRRVFARSCDVVLTPTLGHLTPKVGHLDPSQDYDVIIDRLLDWVCFTPLQNATGDPAISVPGGMSGGIPVGVQLAGPHGSEAILLELAYELEALRPFPQIQRQ